MKGGLRNMEKNKPCKRWLYSGLSIIYSMLTMSWVFFQQSISSIKLSDAWHFREKLITEAIAFAIFFSGPSVESDEERRMRESFRILFFSVVMAFIIGMILALRGKGLRKQRRLVMQMALAMVVNGFHICLLYLWFQQQEPGAYFIF
jgi:hypothetical protein